METFEFRRRINGTARPCGVGRIGPRGSSFLFPIAGREDVEEVALFSWIAEGTDNVTFFVFRRRVDGTAGPCGVGRIGPRGSSFLFPVAWREEVEGWARFSAHAEGAE